MAREQTKTIEKPLTHQTRLRLFLGRLPGEGLTRFRVQLEHHAVDEWQQIVGSDHNPAAETGHDVTVEGVHLDVYRGGERIDRKRLFESTTPENALSIADDHIKENYERYVRDYRQWLKNQTESGR